MCRVSEMCVVGYPIGCLCELYVVLVVNAEWYSLSNLGRGGAPTR